MDTTLLRFLLLTVAGWVQRELRGAPCPARARLANILVRTMQPARGPVRRAAAAGFLCRLLKSPPPQTKL